jgi:DNA helicase-2/ATP-dependent DNA helicase PcrA
MLLKKYNNYQKYAPLVRVTKIYEDLVQLVTGDRSRINKGKLKELIFNMFHYKDSISLYNLFLESISREDMFVVRKRNFEYSDLFPLAYIKVRMEGPSRTFRIKHLIIDEMQDYTPVCYALINELFKCPKTVLGDIAQSVTGISTTLDDISSSFENSIVVTLNKSYRSTSEIIEFAKKISRRANNIEPVLRHGNKVQVTVYSDINAHVTQAIQKAKASGLSSIAIICKTYKQSLSLYEQLKDNPDISHITEQRDSFVKVMPIQMAKGLEFDSVIVVDCDDDNYHTENERDLLYVACTRAMHNLELIYSGKLTRFVEL